jgi:GNAT superfamily N-acetyltransferase
MPPDPTITIREATPANAATLADIERRSPLMLGDSQLAIDRGDDYFAAARLMEDATVFLAEVDGAPAGVYCGALHPVRLGGIERNLTYIHHARILPEYQRHGLGRKLGQAVGDKYRGRSEGNHFYISRDNANSQGYARTAKNRWSFGPTLVDIDTAATAGPPAGRPATPSDAPRIAEILNATHAAEEMFLPYTAESLIARLERAPAQYGWDRLWLHGDAVVGVWPQGESITARYTDATGHVTESRTASALDYGCLPGAEPELLDLLRAWSAWLAPRGISGLELFTSPGSRLSTTLTPLGETTTFDFWTPEHPEPASALEHGLYVDHIYF